MSVTEVIEKLSTAASAAAAAPATTPVVTEEPKVPVIPAEAPPKVDTPEGTPTEVPAEEPGEEVEPNLEEQPETSGDFARYKPLFKEHPELRNILGREKAFSELGEFSVVREVMTRFPTVEDAETLVNDADTKREFSRSFREDQSTFISSLKESDPLAFQQLASKLPEILAETDLRLWQEQARAYIAPVLSNAFMIAQNQQDAELAKAVQMVSQALQMPLGAPAPRQEANPELERLRREAAERQTADKTAAFDSFWGQTDNAIIESTVGEIEKTLKTAVPQATPQQLKRMVGEVYSKTIETLGAQPQFTSQIQTYRSNAEKGRMGIADHKAIVDFSLRRAKLVIPKAAKDIITEWNSGIIQNGKSEIEKKQAIAKTTKDAGTGPQGTSAVSTTPATTGPRHLKDVFKDLENKILGAR